MIGPTRAKARISPGILSPLEEILDRIKIDLPGDRRRATAAQPLPAPAKTLHARRLRRRAPLLCGQEGAKEASAGESNEGHCW